MLFTEVMKDNSLFSKCFRTGRYVSCGFAVVYFRGNGLPFNRLGLSVGKKQGGAVQRNRIKRVFRAAYRAAEADFPIGYDIVVAARGDASGISSADAERFFRSKASRLMSSEGRKGKDSKKKPRRDPGNKV